MLRISPWIEKLERRAERKIDRYVARYKGKLVQYTLMGLIGFYFYIMFVGAVKRGIDSTFGLNGSAIQVIDWNPFHNLAALFSSQGFGVTFFLILMTMLVQKKGYQFLSGYKFERDQRGFNILPDATHGSSGFMKQKEMENVLTTGAAKDLNGTILGKIKEDPDDSDKFAEYITPKIGNGLNEHIIVYGASGAGKSRGFVKPFCLQLAKRKESLVLADPKGEFYQSTSEFFRSQGYIVRSLNLLDMLNSDGWNGIADIETDKNLVQSMAEVIIRNTSNANERQDFWEKAEMNLFMALIHYVQGLTKPGTNELLPIEQRSLGTIYKMLCGDALAEIEQIMNALPHGHPAIAPYGLFKNANRQIWGNIAIGLGNRLSVFQNDLVDKITKYNEIDLELPGKVPCVYYCIISDQDSSLEFLSSLFFSTLFTRLTNYARRHGDNGRLPVPVNVCLDEFCNIGKILDFKKIISTVRSRRINCQIIIQSTAQLSDRYEKKEWEELIGNCDIQLFLGCNDQMTAEYISKKCGMVTIGVTNNSMPIPPLFSPVLNTTRPYSQTKSNTQRALMMPDEVLRLPNHQSLLLLRGQKPLMLEKIIPDELPSFSELKSVSVTDYVPAWRKKEEEREALFASSKEKIYHNPSDTKNIANDAGASESEEILEIMPDDNESDDAPIIKKIDETTLDEVMKHINSK